MNRKLIKYILLFFKFDFNFFNKFELLLKIFYINY